MEMIEFERGSLLEMQISPCVVRLDCGIINEKQSISLPSELRSVVSVDGWLCEFIGAKIFVRHGRRNLRPATDGMSLSFSPSSNIEVTYSAGTRKSESVQGVSSIHISEKSDHTIIDFDYDGKNASDAEETNGDRDKGKTTVENIKKRLANDSNTVKTMEMWKQVKKGLISDYLRNAEKEIEGFENNKGQIPEHLERAERELCKAEKLMALVIQKQEETQNTIEMASQTTEKIDY